MSHASLVLVLVLVAVLAESDGFQVSLNKIESRRSQLMRTGVNHANLAANGQPMTHVDDREYIANVSIGTPPQHFRVMLDLSTSVFYVPDKTCAADSCPKYCNDPVYCKSLCDAQCCKRKMNTMTLSHPHRVPSEDGYCGSRNRFDSSKSSTYHKNGTQFQLGADWSGFIGVDTVILGDKDGLTIRDQTFGQLTSGGFFDDNNPYDGTLGIGPLYTSPRGMVPPLVNAKQLGLVPHDIFTIALIRKAQPSPGAVSGTITYGDFDTNNCGPVRAYVPSADISPSHVNLNTVSFGGFSKMNPSTKMWTAVFDFYSTALNGPLSIMDSIANEAGAEKIEDTGLYSIACNATIPSLYLTFGVVKVEIPPAELIQPSSSWSGQKCVFNIFGDTLFDDFFNIGSALGNKNCLVIDHENRQLGIATNHYN